MGNKRQPRVRRQTRGTVDKKRWENRRERERKRGRVDGYELAYARVRERRE